MTAFFNTHHASVGAWASLTFGSDTSGVSIDHQNPIRKESGAMLFGYTNPQETQSLVFAQSQRAYRDWNPIPFAQVQRTLTPAVDLYQAGKLQVKVYTPYCALPDPQKGPMPASSCLPGVLMDITLDNTAGQQESTLFWGLQYRDAKRINCFSTDSMLGYAYGDQWGFAAEKTEGAFLVQGGNALQLLQQGKEQRHPSGPAFLGLRVQTGKVGTLTITWAVHESFGSSGALETTYYYHRFFKNLEASMAGVLQHGDIIRRQSEEADAEFLCADKKRYELFSQAIRAYYASSQLLEDARGQLHWNIGEGAYLWRNTLDLCADHMIWELKRNPWVLRSLMDEYIAHYAYHDTVTFPDRQGEYPGGISFAHDMGCFFNYAPHGQSAYERENATRDGFYYYMTTDQLMNGIYCICGYTLWTGDDAWLAGKTGLLAEFMTSLENRDAPRVQERTGLLKATTTKGGACQLESTTYDSLDHALLDACGNVYIFIKAWCSLHLIQRCALRLGQEDVARRASCMLEKCRVAAAQFQSETHPWLKANALRDVPGAVSAAIEPLTVPFLLGALRECDEPQLFDLLRCHGLACLQEGVCLDAVSGGLRLSSNSCNAWTSKVMLTLYAMENALHIPVPASVEQELVGWMQQVAKEVTVSDQINVRDRSIIGGLYYPRAVTAAVWMTAASGGQSV